MFIPKEINRRGNTEVYLQALRRGSANNTHCNLIVLGQERVGKTSLIKSILGKDFDQDCKPTQGVEISSIGTELTEHILIRAGEPSEDEEQPWASTSVAQHASYQIRHTIAKELSGEVAVEEGIRPQSVEKLSLAHALNRIDEIAKAATERSQKENLKARSEGTPHALNPSLLEQTVRSKFSEHLKQQARVAEPAHMLQVRPTRRPTAREIVAKTYSGDPQQPSNGVNVAAEVSTTSMLKPSPEPLARTSVVRVQSQISNRDGCEAAKQVKKSSQNLDPTFHTIDFAGQKHYRPMHHCFITHRALYIVAFKLPEMVKCIKQPSDHNAGVLSELQYWLNNIYAHASRAVHGENLDPPKIFLVGTHKCPSFVSSDEKDVAESDLEMVDKLLKNKLLLGSDDRFLNSVVYTDDEKCFFALENSMSPKVTGKRNESGIIPIQKKLKKIVGELKFFKIVVPISWMKFEKKLMDMREELHKAPLSTTRDDVWAWAKGCGMDEEEFQVAMQYFHDIRIIIDQGMCLSFVSHDVRVCT